MSGSDRKKQIGRLMKKYKAVRYLVMAGLFVTIFCRVLKKTIIKTIKRRTEQIGAGRMFCRITAVLLVCSLCVGLIFWQSSTGIKNRRSSEQSSEVFTAHEESTFQKSTVKTAVLEAEQEQPGNTQKAEIGNAETNNAETRKTLAAGNTEPDGIPLTGPGGESVSYKTLSFAGQQKAQVVYDLDQVGKPAFPDVSGNEQPVESRLGDSLSIKPGQQDLLTETGDGQRINPDYEESLWGEFQVKNISQDTMNEISVSGNDVRSYSWLTSTDTASKPAAVLTDVSQNVSVQKNDVSSDNTQKDSEKDQDQSSQQTKSGTESVLHGISLKPGEELVIDLKMPDHTGNDGFSKGILTISAKGYQDDTVMYGLNTALAKNRNAAYESAVQDGDKLKEELIQKENTAAETTETEAESNSEVSSESSDESQSQTGSSGNTEESVDTQTGTIDKTDTASQSEQESKQSSDIGSDASTGTITKEINDLNVQTANKTAAVLLVKADDSQAGSSDQGADTPTNAGASSAGTINQGSSGTDVQQSASSGSETQQSASSVLTWKAETSASSESSIAGKQTIGSEVIGSETSSTETIGSETAETETLSADEKMKEIEKQVGEKQAEDLTDFLKDQKPQVETVFWKNISKADQTFLMKEDSGAVICFYDPNSQLEDKSSDMTLLSGFKGEESTDGCLIQNGIGTVVNLKEGEGEYHIILKSQKDGSILNDLQITGLSDRTAPEISRSDTGKVMPIPYQFRFDVKDAGGIQDVKVLINGVPYPLDEKAAVINQSQICGQMAATESHFEIPFEEQGEYHVQIEAKDLSGNVTDKEMTLKVLPGDLYSVIIPTEFPLHMDLKKLVREYQVESDDLVIKNRSYRDVEVNLRHLNISVNTDNAGEQEKSAELNLSLYIGSKVIDLGTYSPGSYNNIKSFHLDGISRENESSDVLEQAILKITGSVSDHSEDLWRNGDLKVSAKIDFTGEDISGNDVSGNTAPTEGEP